MSSKVSMAPVFNALDSLGAPLAGGKVYVFQAGTTTLAAVYQDAALTVPHPHPLTLDASGNATIHWPVGVYRIRVTTSAGVLEWEVDDYVVSAIDASAQASTGLLANGSFEGAVDATGMPDGWTLVPDASGSVALDTTAPADGANALKFVSPGGPSSGGGIADSDPFPVTDGDALDVRFMLKASVATLRAAVDVLWYDAALAQLGGTPSTNLYDNATTNPAAWTAYTFPVTASAGARFARVRLHGGIAGAAAPAGSIWFDAVSVGLQVDAATLGGLAAASYATAAALDQAAGMNALYTTADLVLVAAQSGFVRIDASTGPVTVTLPSASAAGAGLRFVFLRWDGTANAVNLARAGGDSISGLVTFALTTQIHTVELVSDGIATWWVAADNNASRLQGNAAAAFAMTANNLSDLASAATARANLGIGLTLVAGTALPLTLPAAGSTSVTAQGAHGLGAIPDFYRVRATCLAAEFGYAIGDVVDLSASFSYRDWGGTSGSSTLWTRTLTIAADAVNVYAAYLSGENVLPLLNRATGAYASATPANWSVVVSPYRLA